MFETKYMMKQHYHQSKNTSNDNNFDFTNHGVSSPTGWYPTNDGYIAQPSWSTQQDCNLNFSSTSLPSHSSSFATSVEEVHNRPNRGATGFLPGRTETPENMSIDCDNRAILYEQQQQHIERVLPSDAHKHALGPEFNMFFNPKNITGPVECIPQHMGLGHMLNTKKNGDFVYPPNFPKSRVNMTMANAPSQMAFESSRQAPSQYMGCRIEPNHLGQTVDNPHSYMGDNSCYEEAQLSSAYNQGRRCEADQWFSPKDIVNYKQSDTLISWMSSNNNSQNQAQANSPPVPFGILGCGDSTGLFETALQSQMRELSRLGMSNDSGQAPNRTAPVPSVGGNDSVQGNPAYAAALATSTLIAQILKDERENKKQKSTAKIVVPPPSAIEDRPKRPLTAYNLFFKDERARLLAESGPSLSGGTDGAIGSSLHTPDDVKRARRMQPHGKMGFRDMARIIAQRWKQLEPEVITEYHRRAALEKEKYRVELAKLKKRRSKKSAIARSNNTETTNKNSVRSDAGELNKSI